MLLIRFTKTLVLILLMSSFHHLLFSKFIQDNHYSFHFSFDKSAFPSAMVILTPYVKVLVVFICPRIERYSLQIGACGNKEIPKLKYTSG